MELYRSSSYLFPILLPCCSGSSSRWPRTRTMTTLWAWPTWRPSSRTLTMMETAMLSSTSFWWTKYWFGKDANLMLLIQRKYLVELNLEIFPNFLECRLRVFFWGWRWKEGPGWVNPFFKTFLPPRFWRHLSWLSDHDYDVSADEGLPNIKVWPFFEEKYHINLFSFNECITK